MPFRLKGITIAPTFQIVGKSISHIECYKITLTQQIVAVYKQVSLCKGIGDGLQDVYIVEGYGGAAQPDTIFINRGDGTWLKVLGPTTLVRGWLDAAFVDVQRIRVVDVNADGYADVHVAGIIGMDTADKIYISTGNPAGPLFNQISGPTSALRSLLPQSKLDLHSLRYGDFTGTGTADLLKIPIGNSPSKYAINPVSEHLLITITDSLGSRIKLSYLPENNQTVYTPDLDVKYPVRSITGASFRVSRVEQDDGVGGVAVTTYRYAGHKYHLRGLGSLGYKQVTSTNHLTGMTTILAMSQDWQLRLQQQVIHTQEISRKGVIIEDASNQLISSVYNYPGGRLYVIKPTGNAVSTRGLENEIISESLTTVNVDGFGNVVNSTTTVKDDFGTYITSQSNHYNLTEPNIQKWFIGLLVRSTVNQTRPMTNFLPKIVAMYFTHDETTGMVQFKVHVLLYHLIMFRLPIQAQNLRWLRAMSLTCMEIFYRQT